MKQCNFKIINNWTDWKASKQLLYQLLCNEDLDILECPATYKCYQKTLGVTSKTKVIDLLDGWEVTMVLVQLVVPKGMLKFY